jgi:predicted ATPase
VIAIGTERGLPLRVTDGKLHEGWLAAARGEHRSAVHLLESNLTLAEHIGSRMRYTYFMTVLAQSRAGTGNFRAAFVDLDRALEFVEVNGQGWWEAELHRVRGDCVRLQGRARHLDAVQAYEQAIGVARRQVARSLELRASTSLARLWAEQGERQKAHDLLTPIHAWFTEGFDTPDLIEAKALLDQLR